MTKLSWIMPWAFLFASSLALEGQESVKTSGSWSGVVINSGCTVDEAFAEAAKCTDNVPGAKLVFYADTTRQIYDLEPQAQAVGHLGDAVTVHGTLEAKRRIEIYPTGRVCGEIQTPVLVVNPGGAFDGKSRMAGDKDKDQSPEPAEVRQLIEKGSE